MKLVTNIVPVRIPKADIQVGVLPYTLDDLKKFRSENKESHLFKRIGNDIYCIPFQKNTKAFGKPKTLNIGEDLKLAQTLLENALITFLRSINRPILSFKPIKFLAQPSLDGPLNKSFLEKINLPEWMKISLQYSISTRLHQPTNSYQQLVIVPEVKTRKEILLPLDKLMEKGIDVLGLNVGVLDPRSGQIRRVGVLDSVNNGMPSFKSIREKTDKEYSLSELYLEAQKEAFNRCLQSAFSSNYNQIINLLDRELSLVRKGEIQFELINKFVSYLKQKNIELVQEVFIGVEDFLRNEKLSYTIAPKPRFIFDQSNSKSDIWHDRGLRNFGPYTSSSFSPPKIRACVICQKNKKGHVEQFLNKLSKGIPAINGKAGVFEQGFVRKYSLENIEFSFFTTHDSSAKSYETAILEAIENSTEGNFNWNIGFVQIDESFRNLRPNDNPYLVSKAALFKHSIPVQEFEYETVLAGDSQLSYVLNNIGLAAYSKMGGIPWLLQANPTIAHEVVFGMSSALVPGRSGEVERIVGITTVFSGDGNYYLSSASNAVPMESFKDELLTSLEKSISKIKKQMNWEEREQVRLVFHSFKPFRDIEVEAVKELMSRIGNYNVEYAFLEVIEDHPFFIFNTEQQGIYDWETKGKKGQWVPDRGLISTLSNKESLIVLTGPTDVKKSNDGTPKPVLLKLHNSSTFHDMTYLSKQVVNFAAHSWRSFFPSSMPVTINYSHLVAKLLGNLSSLERWDSSVMIGKLASTRWFL